MRKIVIRVCISCKKCHGKVIDHLRGLEGVKEVIDFPDAQKIEAIGDFKVDDVLCIFEHCKLQKKFAIQSIEELPKPEPPKAPPEEKPKKKEEAPSSKPEKKKEEPKKEEPKKADPPKKKKEPEPEWEPDVHDHEEPEPEPEHEHEPYYHPPTIIVTDSLPTSYSYDHEPSAASKEYQQAPGSSMDMAILIGLVLVVVVLLASVTSSSSTESSMTEAAATLMTGFIESTIATLGSLFLIILALFAVMGFLCLADPKPRPCNC